MHGRTDLLSARAPVFCSRVGVGGLFSPTTLLYFRIRMALPERGIQSLKRFTLGHRKQRNELGWREACEWSCTSILLAPMCALDYENGDFHPCTPLQGPIWPPRCNSREIDFLPFWLILAKVSVYRGAGKGNGKLLCYSMPPGAVGWFHYLPIPLIHP